MKSKSQLNLLLFIHTKQCQLTLFEQYCALLNWNLEVQLLLTVANVMFMLTTGSLTTGYSKIMYFARDYGECSLTDKGCIQEPSPVALSVNAPEPVR